MTATNIKNFIIRVSDDGNRVEFHTANMLPVVPSLPLVKGIDRMSSESNVSGIVNHVKDMMRVEGFNWVSCMKNNSAIYHEIVTELKHIPGLGVKQL